jgi:hypothetical protein
MRRTELWAMPEGGSPARAEAEGLLAMSEHAAAPAGRSAAAVDPCTLLLPPTEPEGGLRGAVP